MIESISPDLTEKISGAEKLQQALATAAQLRSEYAELLQNDSWRGNPQEETIAIGMSATRTSIIGQAIFALDVLRDQTDDAAEEVDEVILRARGLLTRILAELGVFSAGDSPNYYRDDEKVQSARGELLLSRQLLADYQEHVLRPGPKQVYFLDFSNMGPPNDFNLGPVVNYLLQLTGRLFRMHMPSDLGVMSRKGGDEFVFLVHADAEGEMQSFLEALEEERNRLFNTNDIDPRSKGIMDANARRNLGLPPRSALPVPGDDRDRQLDRAVKTSIDQTVRFATLRSGMRKLRTDFVKAQGSTPNPDKLDMTRFQQWLPQPVGGGTWYAATGNHLDQTPTYFAKSDLRHSWVNNAMEGHLGIKPRICSADVAMCRFDGDVTPEQVYAFLSAADSCIHAAKLNPKYDGSVLEVEAGQLDAIDADEKARNERLITEFNQREDKIAAMEFKQRTDAVEDRSQIRELDRLEMQDAASGARLRELENYNLQEGVPMHVAVFDIAPFGPINNCCQYTVADNCLQELRKAIEADLSRGGSASDPRMWHAVYRGAGGSLIVLTYDEIPEDRMTRIQKRAEKALFEQMPNPETVAFKKLQLEARERKILRAHSSGDFTDVDADDQMYPVSISTLKYPALAVARHPVYGGTPDIHHGDDGTETEVYRTETVEMFIGRSMSQQISPRTYSEDTFAESPDAVHPARDEQDQTRSVIL